MTKQKSSPVYLHKFSILLIPPTIQWKSQEADMLSTNTFFVNLNLKSYKLTYIHFANFKHYVYYALVKQNVQFDLIIYILTKMDGFKSTILNHDSLKEIIDKLPGGLNQFAEDFIQQCQHDKACRQILNLRGKSTMVKHSVNMFNYLFERTVQPITTQDLKHIHGSKSIITELIFEQFKQHASFLVNNLDIPQYMIQDFEDEWTNIKPLMLGQVLPYQRAGGWDVVQTIAKLTYDRAKDHTLLMKIYNVNLQPYIKKQENEIDPLKNIQQMLKFALSGSMYFKRSDLIVIHSSYKIEKIVFDDLITVKSIIIMKRQCLHMAIRSFNADLQWIVPLLTQYKDFVVQ